MLVKALRLFLSESAALALEGDQDGETAFSSALHARHKVAKSELEALYNAADEMQSASPERGIAMCFLLMAAGAAYKNPAGFIAAANLGACEVYPHWEPGKAHTLKSAVLYEPMNLWAGWSVENTANGKSLDPHYLKEYKFKGNKSMVSTLMTGASSSNSVMTQVSKELASKPTISFATPIKEKHTVANVMSPHSANLSLHSEVWDGGLVDHAASEEPMPKKERKKLVQFLRDEIVPSNRAGDEHYAQLLSSLTKRGEAGADDFRILTNARTHWKLHRDQLETYIGTLWQMVR